MPSEVVKQYVNQASLSKYYESTLLFFSRKFAKWIGGGRGSLFDEIYHWPAYLFYCWNVYRYCVAGYKGRRKRSSYLKSRFTIQGSFFCHFFSLYGIVSGSFSKRKTGITQWRFLPHKLSYISSVKSFYTLVFFWGGFLYFPGTIYIDLLLLLQLSWVTGLDRRGPFFCWYRVLHN